LENKTKLLGFSTERRKSGCSQGGRRSKKLISLGKSMNLPWAGIEWVGHW